MSQSKIPSPNNAEESSDAKTKIHVIAYGPQELEEHYYDSTDKLTEILDKYPVCWIDVDGGLTQELLESFGKIFSLHELALEDVLNFDQRSKVDDYDTSLYIVTRMITKKRPIESEQLSLFLGHNYLLTFQEKPHGDCLEPLRQRLRKSSSKIRKLGADYLTYCVIDAVVDGYFPILEDIGERVEILEDSIFEKYGSNSPARIHDLKRDTLTVRGTIWPLRDSINSLCRDENPLISDHTRVYLRDCYDHAIRIIDIVEMYREIGHDLMDIYLSAINNRMNETMKVLTIITTIFIPPTFIAGVYGMNFDANISPFNMPELRYYFGYPMALLAMLMLSVITILFLKRKGWLGSTRNPRLRR